MVHEFEVQSDSGVMRKLLSLPLYTRYAGEDFAQKKMHIDYKLWVRPTILWKLECEAEWPRRLAIKSIFDAEKNRLEIISSNGYTKGIAVICLILLPMWGGTILCIHSCYLEDLKPKRLAIY